MARDQAWLSLMIGNSRLHWGLLNPEEVKDTWDTDHLSKSEQSKEGVNDRSSATEEGIPLSFLSPLALETLMRDGSTCSPVTNGHNGSIACIKLDPERFRVASVVPEELQRWISRCPGIRPIASEGVIDGVESYPTLGVDRALALRGAALQRGWPVMVVDCGSALTFTVGDQQGRLCGGAILPGVRLQLRALGQSTAQLPSGIRLPDDLPPRLAMSTAGGIQAGIMWTLVAGIQSFIRSQWKQEPATTVVFTGGDGKALHKAVIDSWGSEEPLSEGARDRVVYTGDVIHGGIASLVETPVQEPLKHSSS